MTSETPLTAFLTAKALVGTCTSVLYPEIISRPISCSGYDLKTAKLCSFEQFWSLLHEAWQDNDSQHCLTIHHTRLLQCSAGGSEPPHFLLTAATWMPGL